MRRGEVWQINLDPTVGSEIRKIRPAVIVNHDAVGILPLKVIVLITDWKARYAEVPWMVRLEQGDDTGLIKVSAADTLMIRSVSQTRFVRQLRELSREQMNTINEALALVLALR